VARQVQGKVQPGFVDPGLISAVSHPVRANCLTVLAEGVASPSQLAAELDLPVQNVAYHIRELVKVGCIELVRTKKGRSTEHFYRMTERPFLDIDAWNVLGDEERATITSNLIQLISDDVNRALAHGMIDDDDNHISRTPMTVDRPGWEEVVRLLRGTLDRILEIEARSVQRRAAKESDPEDSIPIKVEILHFRSPSKG